MSNSRRAAVLAIAGAVAAALAPALLITPAAAVAATPCAPAGFSASAGADLLHVSALNIAPLGARLSPLADVTIGDGRSDIAHALPGRASASADYLTATLLGLKVPDKVLFSHASQTVPPPPAAPDEHFVAKVQTPVLRLGVGHVKASAGSTGGFACGAASSFASVDDLALLPGVGRSLFEMPDNLNGQTSLAIITQNGHPGARAVASAGLADFTILRGTAAAIGVKVITQPTLTGIAGGTLATSSVTYTSPVLDVTLPGGAHVHLDATHSSTDVTSSAFASLAGSLLKNTTLPLVGGALGSGKVHVHLAIGEFSKSVGAHAVSGAAATLRLTVSVETSAKVGQDAPENAPEIGTPSGDSGGVGDSGDVGGVGGIGGGVGGLLGGVVGGVLSGAGSRSGAGHLELASVPAVHTSTVLDLGIGLLAVNAGAPGNCDAAYGAKCGGGDCVGYCSPPTGTPSSPVGTPSSPGGSPSPTPTGTSTPTSGPHAPVPSPTVKGTTGLPTTGGPTVWFVALGGLLLGAGAAIMRIARRRSAL